MTKELILGCGHNKNKSMANVEYENPTTIDINPDVNPDIILDLSKEKLPFEDNTFDEIHAYQVLEHLGMQGQYILFFSQFEDYWRVLKPNGLMIITVPNDDNKWTWGDPGHCRVINSGTLTFLDQEQYKKQLGKTSMTDYRNVYKGNFKLLKYIKGEVSTLFVLICIK